MTTILAQVAGQPLTWWQGLLTLTVIVALTLAVVVVLFGRR